MKLKDEITGKNYKSRKLKGMKREKIKNFCWNLDKIMNNFVRKNNTEKKIRKDRTPQNIGFNSGQWTDRLNF